MNLELALLSRTTSKTITTMSKSKKSETTKEMKMAKEEIEAKYSLLKLSQRMSTGMKVQRALSRGTFS